MNRAELRELANKHLEMVFAEEIKAMYKAAQNGRYGIILDSKNLNTNFIDYLREKDFTIGYQSIDNNLWHYDEIPLSTTFISKIYVGWQ